MMMKAWIALLCCSASAGSRTSRPPVARPAVVARAGRRSLLCSAPALLLAPPAARAALVCVDGKGRWCDGLRPAENERAQSTEASLAAYREELKSAATTWSRRRTAAREAAPQRATPSAAGRAESATRAEPGGQVGDLVGGL